MKYKYICIFIVLFGIICIFILNQPLSLIIESKIQQENTMDKTDFYVLPMDIGNREEQIISKYEHIKYVDKDTFYAIKQIYSDLDLEGVFQLGDTTKYDLYKKQFIRLLNNEVTFTQKDTGENSFLNEFGFLSSDSKFDDYYLNQYTFYFFDMDGDNTPELCIKNKASFIYIFKYNENTNQFALWQAYDTSYIFLMGTKQLGYAGNSRNAVFKLDEKGNNECYFWFKSTSYANPQTNEHEPCYLVTLPQYTDEQKKIGLTDAMKKIAFFDEDHHLYFFRLTEEQYTNLIKDYEDARKTAQENIKEVTYAYEELFGPYF